MQITVTCRAKNLTGFVNTASGFYSLQYEKCKLNIDRKICLL